MRFILMALLLATLGCDRLQKKPKSAEEAKKDQQQGTDDAAKEFAKTVVSQQVGTADVSFGLRLNAKQTSLELGESWWEITGTVKTKNAAGDRVSEDFSVTAVKPVDSNRWKWVMCSVGEKTYNNASAIQ